MSELKTFKLQPIEGTLNDSNWQASNCHREVLIAAANEKKAWSLAAQNFGNAVKKGTPSQPIPANPWSKIMGLVECTLEEDPSTYAEEGIIEPAEYK